MGKKDKTDLDNICNTYTCDKANSITEASEKEVKHAIRRVKANDSKTKDDNLTHAQLSTIKTIKSLVEKHFIGSDHKNETIIITTKTNKYNFRVERDGSILFHEMQSN